jgi:hypothetical protein
MTRLQVGYVPIPTNADLVEPLIRFFRQRNQAA